MRARFGERARPASGALVAILVAWVVTLPVAAALGFAASRLAMRFPG
jgi:phosphate/sulfate permease